MIKLLTSLIVVTLCCLNASGRGRVRVEHFTEKDGFSQSTVTNIIQDSVGYIWVASWDGLLRYDGYRFRSYKARPGDHCPLETNRIDDLCEADSGRIHCKSNEKFYYLIRQTGEFVPTTRTFTRRRTPVTPDVRELLDSLALFNGIDPRILFTDRQGGIWVASNRGLDRISVERGLLKPSAFRSREEETVRGLYEDRQQRVWVADKRGRVRIVAPGEGQGRYLSPSGRLTGQPVTFGKNVYAILQDRTGDYWLGCKPGGLFRLCPDGEGGFGMTHYTHRPTDAYSLSHDEVYSIVEDRFGRLWVGTYGGGLNLVERDAKGNVRFVHAGNRLTGYPQTAASVYCLHAHSKDVLFIGTTGGLYACPIRPDTLPERVEFRTFLRNPGDARSLSNNRVMDMVEGDGGDLYIATYGGGLNCVRAESVGTDTLSFTCHTVEDGLASDVIISLEKDGDGNVWCVSEAALSCYRPSTGAFDNYMQGFFSGGFSFVESAFICRSDRVLVAGTTGGLLPLHPEKMKKSRFVPPIAIDGPENICLTPDERTLALDFAALDYDKRVPIRYAYRFGNEEEGRWNYTTDNRINLTNIPSGTSLLHLRSTNGDGMWVENGRTVTIHRTPHFNERPAAWMLYGCLLLVAVTLVVKTVRYILRLREELNDVRLTTGETIEFLRTKLQESLAGREEKKMTAEPAVSIPETDDELFRGKVETLVADNLGNPDLDVEAFAREMGVSRSVLYLQMKRLFGCTPNNYLQEMRLAHARRMMEAGHGNISEIAYKCGFSDPKYFSRCFKKSVGQTPTEYMERCRIGLVGS